MKKIAIFTFAALILALPLSAGVGTNLTVDDFNTFAVRLTSVGPVGGDEDDREGSSKLNDGTPVSEPATMLLLGVGKG